MIVTCGNISWVLVIFNWRNIEKQIECPYCFNVLRARSKSNKLYKLQHKFFIAMNGRTDNNMANTIMKNPMILWVTIVSPIWCLNTSNPSSRANPEHYRQNYLHVLLVTMLQMCIPIWLIWISYELKLTSWTALVI